MATSGVGPDRPRAEEANRWSWRLRDPGPLRTVLIAGAIALALVAFSTATAILEFRSREINEARRSLANLNELLAESTSRALQSVDLILAGLVEDARADGLRSPDDLRRLRSDRATHEALKARAAALPQLNAISIVGDDGQLINYSRAFPVPSIGLSDRDHFQALKAGPVPEPFLSEPVMNRGTGEYTVYLARRITGPGESFVGAVYAAIELRYFQRFYASLDFGRDSSTSLWRSDGTLLVRHPPLDDVGRRLTSPAFREGAAGGGGPYVYESPSGLDGRRRLVARRPVPGFPLVSITSRTMDDVLAEWRRQSVAFAVLGFMVALAIVAVMTALSRQLWAHEEVGRALEERANAIQGREEVEAQLRQSQKLEAIGQLTSGIAHDFNNLLTVVLGNLDILARRLPDELSHLRRHVDGARGGAERAAGLTKRLLAFSRRQNLEPKALDVNELVRGMSDLLRQTLGENVALDLDLDPAPLWIFADPNGLEAALLNLVVNARDAMPDGGSVTVETRGPADESDRICLGVLDTGTGMTAEILERVFEPFFTTKEPGVGTGLGLPQVYSFAKQSGGDVRIESRVGAGTRVTIHLPVLDGNPGLEPEARSAATQLAVHRASGLALLVDDNEAVRSVASAALERAGFAVREAGDGAAALRIVEEEPSLALLLTDIGLPGINGRQLAASARRLRPDLPIVLMTGYEQEMRNGEAPEEQAFPLVRKPFTPAGLADRIAAILRDRAAARST